MIVLIVAKPFKPSLNLIFVVGASKCNLICCEKLEFLKDQQRKMGLNNDHFIAVSFDPLPAISKKPINVDAMHKWIYGVLESEGKELLFAKSLREKDDICKNWIN